MRWMIFLMAVAIVVTGEGRPGWAQSYRQLTLHRLAGQKVRIHTPDGRYQGIIQRAREGYVELRLSDWLHENIAVEDVTAVEVYDRNDAKSRTGMMIGGFLGLGMGVGVGSLMASEDSEQYSGRVLLGGLGLMLGATLGSHWLGTEWDPLAPGQAQARLSLSPQAVAVHASF